MMHEMYYETNVNRLCTKLQLAKHSTVKHSGQMSVVNLSAMHVHRTLYKCWNHDISFLYWARTYSNPFQCVWPRLARTKKKSNRMRHHTILTYKHCHSSEFILVSSKTTRFEFTFTCAVYCTVYTVQVYVQFQI